MPEDNSTLQIEILKQQTTPRLSEGFIDYTRSLLENAAWCEEHPVQADNLRRTMTDALKATGQDRPPPPDPRSPAQALHDRRYGVSFSPEGNVTLPEALAAVIAREAEDEPADRNAVAAQLTAAGMDPARVVADAQALLDKAGLPVKAGQLSAYRWPSFACMQNICASTLRAVRSDQPQRLPPR
jgi:hypothetical protein